MEEREKMLAGEWYDANNDPDLLKARNQAKDHCQIYNIVPISDVDQRQAILKDIVKSVGDEVDVLSPFTVDYGSQLSLGNHVFVNHNAYFMDCASITIGDHVFIGPSCGFYTAIHPLNAKMRNRGLEKALPITIESNVWLGGDVTVLPGVTIGQGAVIAAGSVVNKDIPANVVAAGVPAKVIKEIDQNDLTLD